MIWLAAALASPLVNPDVPVQLLDIDSDGFVDVVLGGGESAHFGDGTGAFGPLTPLYDGLEAERVFLGDLDGDGLDEVCRATGLRMNCHHGGLRPLGLVMISYPDRTLAELATDVDGDGDVDLLLATLDGVVEQVNDGTGFFTEGQRSEGLYPDRFVEADVDGDGDLDVVAVHTNANPAWWFERDAAGALSMAEVLVSSVTATSVAFVDATGDGLADLLTQSYTHPIYLRERGGSSVTVVDTADSGSVVPSTDPYGPVQPIGGHTGPFVAAALDPAAAPGLLVCDDGEVRWDAGIDGGYQALWPVEEPTDRLCRTPVHDIDGDGVLDVLSVTRELAVVLDPLGASTTSVLQQVPASVGAVGAGDLDGDGVLDVVYGGSGNGRLWWLRGDGDGRFEAVQDAASLVDPAATLDVIDLDQDGTQDVVVVDERGSLSWLRGLGGGTFGPQTQILNGVRASTVLVDGDRDGDLDLVAALGVGGTAMLDDAAGTVVVVVQGADAFIDLASGDTDGDGHDDVVGLTNAGDVVVFRTGAGLTEDLRGPAPVEEAYAVVATDLDGDGVDHIQVMGPCELGYAYGSPNYPYCLTDERIYELAEGGAGLADLGLFAEASGPMAAVDWEQDGTKDLVVSTTSLSVFDGKGAPGLLRYDRPSGLVPADVDGDGDVDLLAVGAGGIWVTWNMGIADGGVDTGHSGGTGDTGGGETTDTGGVDETGVSATGDTGGSVPKGTEPTAGTEEDEEGAGCGCASAAGVGSWGAWGRRR